MPRDKIFFVGNVMFDTRLRHTTLTILDGAVPQGRIPEKWDGKAAERIVQVLLERA